MKTSPNREQLLFLTAGGIILLLILLVVAVNMMSGPPPKEQVVAEEMKVRPQVVLPTPEVRKEALEAGGYDSVGTAQGGRDSVSVAPPAGKSGQEPPAEEEENETAADPLGKVMAPAGKESGTAKKAPTPEPQQQAKATAPRKEPEPAPAAKVEEPTPSKPAAANTGTGKYSVQMGSFSKKANADGVEKRIRDIGLPAWQETVTVKGTAMFRVRAGPFATKEEADKAAKTISSKAGYNGTVVSQGR